MAYIELNLDDARTFLDVQPESLQKKVNTLHKMIHEKTGLGSDYLGWLDLPKAYDKEEYARLLLAAKKIRKQSKVLVVIGIGGSYLGAKAAIEFLKPYYAKRSGLKVIFAGHNMSSTYLSELHEHLQNKDFSINVISKSGTTTEPAIAFRLFKKLLEKKYGVTGSKDRIYVTTDKSKGALRILADKNGYESFVVPNDIGGRYSVLTPVGLLPIAAAGINILAIHESDPVVALIKSK